MRIIKKVIMLILAAFMLLLFIIFLKVQKGSIISIEAEKKEAIPVVAASVKKELLTDIIESVGIVKANESVNITSTVSDRISGIFFEDGDRVEKGQVLVTLNSDEEESLLMQAQAVLTKQKLQSKRIQHLLKRNAASRAQAEEEEGLLKIARAKVANIEARLRDYKIRAPFAGVLAMRMVSLGAVIDSSTVITRLDDISSVKLDFQVPETLFSSIQPGMSVNAKAKAWPDKIFQGTVTVISSCVNPDSRSLTIRTIIPNPEYILKPGMQMIVDMIKNQSNSLIIPKKALITDKDKKFVLVVDEKAEVSKREVSISRKRSGVVEITSGLEEGEKVIIEGIERVHPGNKVKIINS